MKIRHANLASRPDLICWCQWCIITMGNRLWWRVILVTHTMCWEIITYTHSLAVRYNPDLLLWQWHGFKEKDIVWAVITSVTSVCNSPLVMTAQTMFFRCELARKGFSKGKAHHLVTLQNDLCWFIGLTFTLSLKLSFFYNYCVSSFSIYVKELHLSTF